MPTIAALFLFGALTLTLGVAADAWLRHRQVLRGLRDVRAIDAGAADPRGRELALPFAQRVLVPSLHRLGGVGRRFAPAGVLERLSRELVYAGNPPGWDAERVLASKILGGAGLTVAGLTIGRLAGVSGLRMVLLVPLLGVVGYYLPEWILRSRSGKRQAEIQRNLPDALDLLSITVEAGLGFDAALSRVANQSTGPLAQEFHRVLAEMQIGKARSETLRDLADRSTVEELKSFVLSMVQADTFGISIGKVLHVQAREMRTKRRQRAEEQAQKVPVKIIFPLITCIFPSLFLVILGPAVVTIWKNFG